jgi:short-subunit dehydrogenase
MSKKIFQGKVVWITGASSGIGEALVYAFVDAGATVVASARNEGELKRVKSHCSTPDSCHIVPLDLTKHDTFDGITKSVFDKFQHVDYLINNGGISQRSTVLETPLEVDRRIMEVNFFGTIALTKCVLPYVVKQGGGHIAATSSIAGKFGFYQRSAYAASKHALHGFFESLRLENRKQNIRVSMIVPGRVKTSISINAIDKDGRAHGKMDEGQSSGISSEKAARQILRGLAKNKREINVGGTELLMLYFKRFLPSLHYLISRNIAET